MACDPCDGVVMRSSYVEDVRKGCACVVVGGVEGSKPTDETGATRYSFVDVNCDVLCVCKYGHVHPTSPPFAPDALGVLNGGEVGVPLDPLLKSVCVLPYCVVTVE